jgi:hypothetical protein
MRRMALMGFCHWIAGLSGWYFVGASAQAAADGVGAAPAWLIALDVAVSVLLFPLALLAVNLVPEIRVFSLPAFAGLALVTAANSALIVGGCAWIYRRSTKPAMAD